MEDKFDDDTENVITNERYVYISSIIGDLCDKKNTKEKLTTSDRIDRIVKQMGSITYFRTCYVHCILCICYNRWSIIDRLDKRHIICRMDHSGEHKSFFEGIGCADWLTGLIVDGVISVSVQFWFRTTDVSIIYFPYFLRELRIYSACRIYHGPYLP